MTIVHPIPSNAGFDERGQWHAPRGIVIEMPKYGNPEGEEERVPNLIGSVGLWLPIALALWAAVIYGAAVLWRLM